LHGDAQLEYKDGAWLRKLSHVEVMVFYRHKGNLLQLFEEKQVFYADGSERQRLYPWVAEKIHGSNEDYKSVFNRALAEELNITNDYCFFAPAVNENIIQESQTYPGLNTSYDIWRTKAIIGDSVFLPEGYCEVREKRSTYFRWLEIPSFHQHLSSSEQVRTVLAERGHTGQ
jgi:hypothetical protein